jgi:hypothetical protein
MHFVPKAARLEPCRATKPDGPQPGEAAGAEREDAEALKRRAAAAWLDAAKKTDDKSAQEALRHRAAELIEPHPGPRRRR